MKLNIKNLKPVLPIVLVFISGTAFSQISTKSGLKVNGVALGDTYQLVVKRLGKPSSESKRRADECVGGTERILNYPGLRLRLWDDPSDARKFTVGFFEVRTAKWNVSGARVGQSGLDIKKLLGTRSSEGVDPKTRLKIWYYEMDEELAPGNTNIVFRNGKVVSIASLWDMC